MHTILYILKFTNIYNNMLNVKNPNMIQSVIGKTRLVKTRVFCDIILYNYFYCYINMIVDTYLNNVKNFVLNVKQQILKMN